LLLRLPNFWQWWDAETREAIAGPQHAYPRYASHALAQILRLGLSVQAEAARSAPAAATLLVITNANDDSVDNRGAGRLVAAWQEKGAQVQTYEFAGAQGLLHDLIDPDQPDQQTAVVYPVLLDLIQAPARVVSE